MKLYDRQKKRLVVFGQEATSKFWEEHWDTASLKEDIESGKNSWFIKKFTSQFLPLGAKILEGGCGRGQNVYGLKGWGYDAYGVDFAEKTINAIKKYFPGLKVSSQDVRNLNFADSFFDGYWSLGVIEHFYEGYEEILKEAARVIKPRGYFFLTFPFMSRLRKLKARLGVYPRFEGEPQGGFYQFILDSKLVSQDVEQLGFKLVLAHPFDATKGLKDEISFLKPVLQELYNSKTKFARALRFIISLFLAKLAGHSILLVFKKV